MVACSDDDVVYLDHAATTPLRSSVLAAMMPALTDGFANPSGSHRLARAARKVIDEARDVVAQAAGWAPGGVVFTSGGTEADNTIITGVRRGRAVCPVAEHHAVLHPVASLDGTTVRVDATAAVDLDALADALSDDVGVVSVMAVNNEVGTINDLAAVASVVRERAPRAVLHTDAVQAGSWLDLASIAEHVDAMSITGHKLGGPKGAGALLVREHIPLAPLLQGGGQERDRRSGTHNVAGIVGFAEALRLAQLERRDHVAEVGAMRDRLVDAVIGELDGVDETVPRDRKVAGSAHLLIDGVEGEALLFLLDRAGVCASAASACASGAMEPSHVLAAMGVDAARAALRMTLGSASTDAGVDRAVDVVVTSVRSLRAHAHRRVS